MRALRWLLIAVAVTSFTSCTGGANGPHKAQCSDGKDNDGDGKIDFPDDDSCASPEGDDESGPRPPQCKDGRDNDGDGNIDYPDDPGCYAPNVNDETDHCPDGSDCPQCSNGKDDDGNGVTDYPADTGCSSAADNDEYPSNPVACGANVHILAVPPNGMIDNGMLMGSAASYLASPMCGGAGTEDVYELRVRRPSIVVATTDLTETSADTILYIRGAQCAKPSSEVTCNENPAIPGASLLQSMTTPGTYYLVVDDRTGQGGSYQLHVQMFAGEGVACTADECGPGLVCRVPMGQTDKVCAKPVCSDGVDDDGDGKLDYPDDPGCQSPTDDTETDSCPSGAGCPKCSNHVDDDNDGKKDYPLDPSCSSAASNGESCHTAEAVGELVGATTLGDTTNATDDYTGACGGSDAMAKDTMYEIDVPKLSSFTFRAVADNFSPHTALLGATCGGTELGCAISYDDPKTVGPLAAGTYFIVVESGYDFDFGAFTLTVSGDISGGASCESPLAQSGALTCAAGYECGGTPGSRTCVPTQCNDGIDNNHDGKIDYPFDPGCSSPSDTTEDTVCPGAMCPVCSNGSDDDNDRKTDYPADFGCSSAGGAAETFCPSEMDPVVVITAATTSSTFAGMTANQSFSCHSSTDVDRAFALELPVPVTSLTIDTLNSANTDTVLQLSDTQCATALACNDDIAVGTNDRSSITVTNLPAGNYAVSVQTYNAATNPTFKLNVHGTVAKGEKCTGPLFTSNALKCATGSTCTAGKCQ